MQPLAALPNSVAAPHYDAAWELAESCIQRTAEILKQSQSATSLEISHGISTAREAHAVRQPADLLDVICRAQGHEGDGLNQAILALSHIVASYISPYAPYVPFAGKLITPTAFYESYSELLGLAKILGSPVIYAEDTDSLCTASINPVASEILAGQIRETIFKKVGIRPFITIVRLDYESWKFLTRKHFDR